MNVYCLAYKNDPDNLKIWNERRGVYGNIWGFEPFEDNSGNLCCGLADGKNKSYPFYSDIASCDIIPYIPKQIYL